MKNKYQLNSLAAVMLISMAGESLFAEEPIEYRASVLDEIIVTAEKRERNIQSVGMSIDAFLGESLERSGIENSQDLQLVTPGLTITQAGSLGNVTIRGIGSNLQGIGSDPSSAVYLDGVYVSRFNSSILDMMDMERVEVLKGPQVILYGRNATAGAIHFVSKSPGDEFGGYINSQVGSFGLIRVGAGLDMPVIDDVLSVRGSVLKIKDDGYTENIVNSSDRPNRQDTLSGRFSAKYTPSDDLEFILRLSFDEEDGSRNVWKAIDPVSAGSSFDLSGDPRKIATNQVSEVPVENRRYSLTAKWSLEWAELTSITAFGDSEFGPLNYDFDGTELTGFHVGVAGQTELGLFQDAETFTQEITLAGGSDTIDWILGGFYLDEDGVYGGHDESGTSGLLEFLARANTEAYAVYGQLSYQVSNKLRLNSGLRYSHESKSISRSGFGVAPHGPLTKVSDSWDELTPYVGFDYALSDEAMVYVTVSTGFKSGAYGSSASPSQPAAPPEKITAYEVGAKSRWLDDRLQLNASAYYYDYTDLQVLAFDISTAISSFETAASAEIQGAELSLKALPTDNLEITMAVSLLDAKYEDYQVSATVSNTGNSLPNAPETTISLGVKYTYDIGSIGDLVWQANYFFSDERFFAANNLLNQNDYSLINTSLSFVSKDSNWEFSVYGKNVTDELVASNGSTFSGGLRAYDSPRTYGAGFKYQF